MQSVYCWSSLATPKYPTTDGYPGIEYMKINKKNRYHFIANLKVAKKINLKSYHEKK